MENEASNDRALEAVNREKGINFPRIIQNALGSLMVALILGLYYWGNNLSDELHTLSEAYGLHVIRGEGKHALLELKLQRLRALKEDCDETQDTLAHLNETLRFPFSKEWQARIRANEKFISRCHCDK